MPEDQQATNLSIQAKLLFIQQELHCPKEKENTFNTHFMYRSNSDILAAVKPLLAKYKCVIIQRDALVEMGGVVYVKAVSTIRCAEASESEISAPAYARENPERRGMDPSQLTGGASSYARKYSLNGLLAIDDTKDPDTQDNSQPPQNGNQQAPAQKQGAQPADTHAQYKQQAEHMVALHQAVIAADPAMNGWVDACMSDGFYKDVVNHLTQLNQSQGAQSNG